MQVLDLAQRPDADIAEIARTISKDPALSSKILRTVNSSFYGRSSNVSTISQSLVILGLQSVKTLVLGFSLVTNLSKNKSAGFNHLGYWRRSIYAATAARTIASKTNLVQQEEAFLAALLGDIGMLVLDQVVGEQYGEIIGKANSHGDYPALETAAFGMTHADVGGILTEQWKLPPILSTPVAAHHSLETVTDPALRKLAEIVWLSGRCADVYVDEVAAPAISDVRKFCLEHFQFTEATCDAMLAEIGTRTKEVAILFEINIGSSAGFEAILKKANETLVELMMQSNQQSTTLQQQNQILKEQVVTDALTGLANRAKFDQFTTEVFPMARKAQKPLSLVMIDVDNFKKINDTRGHPAGDQVLRMLGKLLKTAARAQDVAARYGGEEMVIVMPGTTRATAASIAETIRRAIAAKPIIFGGVAIPVTASFGVVSYEPGSPFTAFSQLVKAADLALYNAKHNGRNCVRVFALNPKPAAAPATLLVKPAAA